MMDHHHHEHEAEAASNEVERNLNSSSDDDQDGVAAEVKVVVIMNEGDQSSRDDMEGAKPNASSLRDVREIKGGTLRKSEKEDQKDEVGIEFHRGWSMNSERICRICHSSSEVRPSSSSSSPGDDESSEIMELGCDCKGELGLCHRQCAETWFKQRGQRLCEICGKIAKNITGVGDTRAAARGEGNNEVGMLTLDEVRVLVSTYASPTESQRRCRQSFRNCLLACLVVAFVLPWFFRGNLF